MSHPALADLPLASPVPPHSWFHHGDQMLALLERERPVVTVELGTWRGGSAIPIARVIRGWGGVLYCVDTWMGNINGGTAPGYPGMLLEAAGHVVRAGVAASVRFIPALTTDAAARWVGPIDCLYVDADHRYASVMADLVAWWPHLRVGGIIAGDDYRSALYPGLTQAWDDFEAATGQTFTRTETPESNPPGMAFIWGIKA